MKRLLIIAALLVLVSGVRAQGIIIGPDGRPVPIELRTHRVDAKVQENVAVVTVEHEFVNHGKTPVEGTLLFPLPADAQVSRFSMEADGKEMTGELLDAEEARRIYEDIVRRALDPALLEMADHRTFRARVFPIPAGKTRTISLRYDLTLPREGATVTFIYPLQGQLSARSTGARIIEGPLMPGQEDRPEVHPGVETKSTIRVELSAGTGLKNVYSPSHEIDVDREGERRAVVESEIKRGLEGRDFVLYYSLDPKDIGATLLAHRPYRDRPGYFMVLVSPPVDADASMVRRKDVVFVLDTSGSMSAEKIQPAKDALRYCLNSLGERDRFGIVTFSSDVDAFRNELSGIDARDDARYFIDQLEARGGTNINEALLAAISMLEDSDEGMVIFLTDGLPSSGVTDEGEIRKNVQNANTEGIRIFSFGVGYDVNTRLLDGLSREAGAFADYISPEENIEERVSTFYDKIQYPMLTDIEFEWEGGEAFSFAPRELPDLYKGGQLILTGRYRNPGRMVLTLRGRLGQHQQERTYQLQFPEVERQRDFVARLWATRRVGILLDDIRLHGENQELKEEVIALAKEFGLVTPYTSYLVQEEDALANAPEFRRAERQKDMPTPVVASEAVRMADAAMAQTSGAVAVQMSKSIREMQEAETVSNPGRSRVTTVNGRTLWQSPEGAWIDMEYDSTLHKPLRLKFASTGYFTLLREHPDLLAFAQLGDRVIFQYRGTFIQIGKEGDESLESENWRKLLK